MCGSKFTLAIGLVFAILANVLVIDLTGHHRRIYTLDAWLWTLIFSVKSGSFPFTGTLLILACGAALSRAALTGRPRYCLAALAVPVVSFLIPLAAVSSNLTSRGLFIVDVFVVLAFWLWLVVFLFILIATTVGILMQRRERRKKIFLICRSCGYSLKALTVARCPECGTPFSPALLGAAGNWNERLDLFQTIVGLGRSGEDKGRR